MGNDAFKAYTLLATKKPVGKDGKDTKDADAVKLVWHLFKLGQENGKGPETIIPAEFATGKFHSNAEAKAEAEAFKAVFAEFAKTLTALKEPRFGVIDVWSTAKDGVISSKLVCFRWSPDSGAVALKMKYAGGEGSFKNKTQAAKVKQCNDASDVTLEIFIAS